MAFPPSASAAPSDSSDLSASSGDDSTQTSPTPTPADAGIGSLVITPPQGMQIPDEGTITLTYKKVPAADGSEADGSSADIELSVQSVQDVQPVGDGADDTSPTPSSSFDKIAKQVRGS